MKRIYYSFLFCLLSLMASAQTFWQRNVTNYDRHTYRAANQNWDISQHDNGWMYFANNGGLLEYDGSFWKTYPLTGGAKARSVKAVGQRVYVGGLGQFGYFAPDARGQLHYTSLSLRIRDRKINIWSLQVLGHRVLFVDDNGAFVYEHGRVWHADSPWGVSTSAVIFGRLYAATGWGLALFVGNKFVHIPGTEQLAGHRIVAMLPYNDAVLIVTADGQFWLLEGSRLTPWQSALAQALAGERLSCAAISRSHIAVGTMTNGVCLYSLHARHITRMSLANGLQNKTVLAARFDQSGNLWLGLDNGISCLPLRSPLYFLNSNMSSIGSGYAAARFGGRLYLGTNQGVYTVSPPDDLSAAVEPQPVAGTEGEALSLTVIGDRLYCGGRNFFTIVDPGGRVTTLPQRGVWHVVPSPRGRGDVVLGTYWGLSVLDAQGNIVKLNEPNISAKTMAVEPATGALWIANKEKGIYRVVLDATGRRVASPRCYNNKVLPKGDNVGIAVVDNQLIVASRHGLFRYDFTNDCLTEDRPLEQRLLGRVAYTFIQQDSQRNIWYVSDGILRVLRYDARRRRYYANRGECYLADHLITDFESLCEVGRHGYVIGTENGFALLKLRPQFNNLPRLDLSIRHLWALGAHDSLVYTKSIAAQAKPEIVIDHRLNSIRLDFSAMNADVAQVVLYSCRLTGEKNEPWSQYSEMNTKEYTDLPEGDYVFHVRTLTASVREPIETTLAFTVLPPWYRSWWAKAIYLILAIAAITALGYAYRRRQRHLQMLNELRIARQRLHYEQESQQKDEQIANLEAEKIRVELTAKSTELINSQLNVVRKNEMLEDIRKTAASITADIDEHNLVNIRRKVLRLMSQIDTNISHDNDMQQFQSSFDAMHHDFFRKLSDRFPQLTHRDLILCAYIHMNLLSKEIAPLMNISVRGVEISRYRLRRKLNLEEGTDLPAFLDKI